MTFSLGRAAAAALLLGLAPPASFGGIGGATTLVVGVGAASVEGVTRATLAVRRGADPYALTSTLDLEAFASSDAALMESVGAIGANESQSALFSSSSLASSSSDVDPVSRSTSLGRSLVASGACRFAGAISLSHPMSMKAGDKFFPTGQLQQKSVEMMVDAVNLGRCGVGIVGERYGLSLTTYGDDSSKDKVGAIARGALVPALRLPANETGETPPAVGANVGGDGDPHAAHFWVGPYSSGLTGILSPYANDTGTVLVAGGAAATSVFQDNPTVFGTFPPTKQYLAQAVESLSNSGAKSAAGVWESASFTRGVCAALPDLAAQYGMELTSMTEVAASPGAEELDPVARNLSAAEVDPDVVVTCVYDKGCAEWIGAMRRAGWSPRAQVFTVCIGMDSFSEAVGTDARYMSGISPWDASLSIRDDVVGWSAAEFADAFLSTTSRTPTYHSASAAASVGTLVQAIERANSFDSSKVAEVLASEEFVTLYGKVRFDANGQSMAPSLFLQYDANVTVQTVYPLEASSGELVYPMPTWSERDCNLVSTCTTGSVSTSQGTCGSDGTCACEDLSAISTGAGPDAACVLVPQEDYTHIHSALRVLGLVLFAIQLVLSVGCAAWTVYYRNRRVVKASQPLFLCLVLFGTLVMSLSIIPLGVQGKYRYKEDETTGEVTDVEDPDVGGVDAACMALPWLFSIGFAVVFSALFAKIWRVKMLFKAATSFIRKTIGFKDVAMIMVVVIALQFVILLCWQIVDPMSWRREVLLTDGNGYPTKSVGYCTSDNILYFLMPLVIVDGLMLFYALYLCFVTRNVPSEFQEGNWITASVLSIIQILILAIPILVIVDNDTNAFYFVRAVVIFLMSSTVTMLIFFPKIYRLHYSETNRRRGAGAQFSTAEDILRRSHAGSAPANSGGHTKGSHGGGRRGSSGEGSENLYASMCSNAASEVEESRKRRVSFLKDRDSQMSQETPADEPVEAATESLSDQSAMVKSGNDAGGGEEPAGRANGAHKSQNPPAQGDLEGNVGDEEELGGEAIENEPDEGTAAPGTPLVQNSSEGGIGNDEELGGGAIASEPLPDETTETSGALNAGMDQEPETAPAPVDSAGAKEDLELGKDGNGIDVASDAREETQSERDGKEKGAEHEIEEANAVEPLVGETSTSKAQSAAPSCRAD
ncbi:hypothetical protein ACHAWF_009574 [Thalassiosira exigua]